MVADVQAAPVELLKNPGFEKVEDGKPVGCRLNGTGSMEVVTEARSGDYALRFESSGHGSYSGVELGGFYAYLQARPINPKARYRFSVWARGEGKVRLNVKECSIVFLRTNFMESFALTPEWQKLEILYTPTDDDRIWQGNPLVQMLGAGWVVLDDASFRFDPADNPGIALDIEPEQRKTVEVRSRAREANLEFYVNGKKVGLFDGHADIRLEEGINVLAVRAEATGETPGVRVELARHPQTLGRWRLATEEAEGWMDAAFDDAKWTVAAPDDEGFIWSEDTEAKAVLMRQVILWNEAHYGPNYCLAPRMKQWGFPRNSVETFHLAIYSPLERPVEGEFTFTFELPRGFRLLDKIDYKPRWIMNLKPERVSTEVTSREGQEFTRYTLEFRPPNQPYPKICRSELAVVMDEPPASQGTHFYYRRELAGNVTELENSIPVEMLPPIRGQMPEKILISLYGSLPAHMPDEHLNALAEVATRAGMNAFSFHPNPGWGEEHRAHERKWHDAVLRHGGRVSLWVTVPLPYATMRKGHLKWYPEWIVSHPEAHDRYFQGKPEWGGGPAPHHFSSGYDKAYVLSPEAGEFWDIIAKEADRFLEMFPGTSLVWADFEHPVLTPDGKGSGGFTDRNKEAFRQWAGLPEDADLSDANIVGSYRSQWEAFRHQQDARIIGKMRQMWSSKGFPFMLYSQGGNRLLWNELKGRIDIAFPGTPGDHPADSYYQKLLDDAAKRFRQEQDFPMVIGQRFPPRLTGQWYPGMGFCKPLSHDGFAHPRSWKSQVIRVVAAMGGGIDLTHAQGWGGGSLYYIGEATRLISAFEPLFWDGERADDLAASEQIKYPNLLVLKLGKERLVLLFNEGEEPLSVVLENKRLAPGQVATVFETDIRTNNPAKMKVTVPPEDCVVVHIK